RGRLPEEPARRARSAARGGDGRPRVASHGPGGSSAPRCQGEVDPLESVEGAVGRAEGGGRPGVPGGGSRSPTEGRREEPGGTAGDRKAWGAPETRARDAEGGEREAVASEGRAEGRAKGGVRPGAPKSSESVSIPAPAER